LVSQGGLGVERLPLTPDPLFWATVSAGIVGVLDARGESSFRLQLPNSPSLRGQAFFVGGVRFNGSGRITRATNAVRFDVPR